MRYLGIVLCLLLAGCGTPPPIDVMVKCPPLRDWTPADQSKLADAMSTVPVNSVLWQLELDWQTQRDAIRACRTPTH